MIERAEKSNFLTFCSIWQEDSRLSLFLKNFAFYRKKPSYKIQVDNTFYKVHKITLVFWQKAQDPRIGLKKGSILTLEQKREKNAFYYRFFDDYSFHQRNPITKLKWILYFKERKNNFNFQTKCSDIGETWKVWVLGPLAKMW